MKVLLANSTCKVGGVSTFMLALRSALVSRGHECELCFFSGGTMEAHLPPEVPVHFGNLADCMRLVERARFDVVHANNIDWTTGISAVRHIGVRLVLTAHKARESAWTYGWTAANCDALATVSEWVRASLQPFTDVPIQVVPNGIDMDRFTPDHEASLGGPPVVAWIGRGGSPLKGLEKLAEIAPGLRRAGLRLWLVDQHGAEKAAAVYPEAARILEPLAERWEGVPFEQMPALYREVAATGGCVLSTSLREGLPLTLLEAQASGCLVIASDVQGNNECVSAAHGGLLFPLHLHGDAVAGLVRDTLADRGRVRARQRTASAYVRDRFSLRRMAEEYLRIYAEPPSASAGDVAARVRARLRLSPLVHWSDYLEQRWGVGYEQFVSSRALARQGEWRLAAGAGRASLRTSPTIFLKPQRLAHLFSVCVRAGSRTASPHAAPRTSHQG
jgi:glycosyltransferase involved in cell wall biosynthesis